MYVGVYNCYWSKCLVTCRDHIGGIEGYNLPFSGTQMEMKKKGVRHPRGGIIGLTPLASGHLRISQWNIQQRITSWQASLGPLQD